MTVVQQQVAVGEGLAIGCISLGVSAVTPEMMTVEFAFQRAWRDWRLASKFKNVHFSVQRNDLLRILDRSERRRGPIVAAWSNGEMLVPYLTMDGWTIEDAADIVLGTCGVSLAGWTELSRGFVAGLGERNFEMSTSR